MKNKSDRFVSDEKEIGMRYAFAVLVMDYVRVSHFVSSEHSF